MTEDEERAKAFREYTESIKPEGEIDGFPIHWLHNLLAELDWAQKNPPYDKSEGDEWLEIRGYQRALAFVRSLLEEPRDEKW